MGDQTAYWEGVRGFDADLVKVDGRNLGAIRAELLRPRDSLVIVFQDASRVRVSFLENRMKSHYLPLTESLYRAAIQEMGGA